MSKLTLITYHTISASGDFELPSGRDVEDIVDIYVKWGNATITFKDGSTHQIPDATEVDTDSADWKHPNGIEVMDESYNIVYSSE